MCRCGWAHVRVVRATHGWCDLCVEDGRVRVSNWWVCMHEFAMGGRHAWWALGICVYGWCGLQAGGVTFA